MQKVVILSYHYPPFDVIASQRALGYARAFVDGGFETIVFSHSWKMENDAWVCDSSDSDVDEEGVRVIRCGISKQATEPTTSARIMRRLSRTKRWKSGDFETHPLTRQVRDESRAKFFELIRAEEPTLVLGIYSPHFNLDWAAESINHGAKNYALDFRDLWDVRANTQFQVTGNDVEFIRKKWKDWSSKAALLSTVSQPYADFLAQEFGKSVVSICNGFTERKTKLSSAEPFTILHAGTFYPHQDLDPIFQVGKRLKTDGREFRLRFIGVKGEMKNRLNGLARQNDLTSKISIEGRIPRAKAMEEIQKAGILFYPCWQGFPGVYSGKIFEYISAEAPILLLPTDENVVQDLIAETGSGAFFPKEEIEAAYEYVVSIMDRTQSTARNWPAIDLYTRSAQCSHYVELVKKLV